jgi:superfamily II DNA or RNA helicase
VIVPQKRSVLPAWSKPLRRCQLEPCQDWVARGNPKDYLAEITPGGGKTTMAARLSYGALRQGLVDKIAFICPATNLRKQVAASFASDGLHLDYRFDNSEPYLSPEMHGIVVTYQQVAARPLIYRDLCRRYRLFVNLDEIHHVGEDARWGDGIQTGFVLAQHRLGLSGTPFRRGNSKIAFVSYDRFGNAIADYRYTYREALRDSVVRKIVFIVFEGQAKWVSGDGKAMVADFSSKLSRAHRSELLRTHLLHENNRDVLAQAHETLMHVRRTSQPNAGGFVIAMNRRHAMVIAERIRDITGVMPPVVISQEREKDDEDSDLPPLVLPDIDPALEIEKFAEGTAPWIVAVAMIAEGVDIRRLRVGVYFTNKRAALFGAQAFGRVARSDPRYPGESYFFIPGDRDIVELAEGMVDDIAAVEQQRRRRKSDEEHVDGEDATRPPREKRESSFAPLSAAPVIERGIHGAVPETSSDAPAIALAPNEPPAPAVQAQPPMLLADHKHELKRELLRGVARVAKLFDVSHQNIHATLKVRCGSTLARASIAQLEKRKKVVDKWLQQKRYDGFR